MTKIEWTDEVWNVVTGCTSISEGCRFCYAKRMAQRLKGRFGYPEDEPFRVTFHPDRLNQPLKWKKPRRIFVCSMGDLGHDDVEQDWIFKIFTVIESAYWHRFLILTKRPEKVYGLLTHDQFPAIIRKYGYDWLGPQKYNEMGPHWRNNQWLGISAENQQTADERIPILLRIPAAKRFVSLEPMLGPVDLEHSWWHSRTKGDHNFIPSIGINWVIVGGLSLPGGKVQAPDPKWIDNIVEQCDEASVPLFIKENAQYHTKREEFPV